MVTRTQKTWLIALAALMASASVPALAAEAVITNTTPSVAFQPGITQIDFNRGIWGTQSINPPNGLVMVKQGDLINRQVYDSSNTAYGTIDYLLVEPTTGNARYAVVSSSNQLGAGAYIAVPLSAMELNGFYPVIGLPARSIGMVPRHNYTELSRNYPVTTLALPVVWTIPPVSSTVVTTTTTSSPTMTTSNVPTVTTTYPGVTTVYPAGTQVYQNGTVASGSSTTTVVTTTPMAAPLATIMPVESLQLAQRGELVGRVVTDSSGAQIGAVEYVAVAPPSGEVRYLIVSGNSFGSGNYIAVPYGNSHLVNGRIMVDVPMSTLTSAPRYQRPEVQQRFGQLGTVN